MAAGMQLPTVSSAVRSLDCSATISNATHNTEQNELLGPINIKSDDDPSMQELQGAHEWIAFLLFSMYHT